MHLRTARPDDLPAIAALIGSSARGLSRGYYTPDQVESLVRYVFGPDRQLIDDGTYYVCETDGMLTASGGWSMRATIHGPRDPAGGPDPLVDPAVTPARIRAFFVHPACARQGLGRRLFTRCLNDAAAAGFREFTLVASLPGEPLYRALGFTPVRRFELRMPDGAAVDATEMVRPIEAPRALANFVA